MPETALSTGGSPCSQGLKSFFLFFQLLSNYYEARCGGYNKQETRVPTCIQLILEKEGNASRMRHTSNLTRTTYKCYICCFWKCRHFLHGEWWIQGEREGNLGTSDTAQLSPQRGLHAHLLTLGEGFQRKQLELRKRGVNKLLCLTGLEYECEG